MPVHSHVSSDLSQGFASTSISSSTAPATNPTSTHPSNLHGNLLSSTNIPTAYVSPDWASNSSAQTDQFTKFTNASMPIPDPTEMDEVDSAGFDIREGTFAGSAEVSRKSWNAEGEDVGEEESYNGAEVGMEAPVHKKSLGTSVDAAEEGVVGDVDLATAEERSHSSGKHSSGTAGKQAPIEKATLSGPQVNLHEINRMMTADYWDTQVLGYTVDPRQITRKKWTKDIVHKYRDYIGLDVDKGKQKALDYGAGTGYLSWALAPYFGEIIGIDISAGMVEEYNAIVNKAGNSKCKMRAVQGDIIESFSHGGYRPEAPEVFENGTFDMVAMTMSIQYFYSEHLNTPPQQREQLMINLDILLSTLVENGTFMIIELENPTGIGREEVAAALRALRMEDISELKGLPFSPDLIDDASKKPRPCYILTARKGKRFEARQKRKSDQSSSEFTQKGGLN